LFLISCARRENDHSATIQDADRVKIERNEIGFDTIIFINKSFLNSFKDVLKNDEGNCDCAPKQLISFYDGSKFLLRFASSQDDKGCSFLIIGNGERRKCYRLNYRIGMFLSEF
jgi:hypothetical protein